MSKVSITAPKKGEPATKQKGPMRTELTLKIESMRKGEFITVSGIDRAVIASSVGNANRRKIGKYVLRSSPDGTVNIYCVRRKSNG